MDYNRLYNNIVNKAKSENRQKGTGIYYEAHHIIPICLGGAGTRSEWKWHPNIVLLTAKEHFICHRLLCRMYPGNTKLVYALWRMCTSKSNNQQRIVVSPLAYEEARLQYIKSNPKKGKKLSGEVKNRMSVAALNRDPSRKVFGRKESEGTRFKKSVSKLGKRNPMFGRKMTEEQKELRRKLILQQPIVECEHCGKTGRGPTMKQFHFSNCKLKIVI